MIKIGSINNFLALKRWCRGQIDNTMTDKDYFRFSYNLHTLNDIQGFLENRGMNDLNINYEGLLDFNEIEWEYIINEVMIYD